MVNGMSTKETKRIDSLQALRAFAFLGIFFLHSGFFVQWAKLGVSIFFVLSGFLLTRKHYNTDFELSFKNNLIFAITKVKKLYLLHIVTMICAIALDVAVIIYGGISYEKIGQLSLKIILNILLLQSWYPNSSMNSSLNGVAWYLSASLFLYFIFPYLLKIIKKTNERKLYVISGIMLCVQIVLCIPFIICFGESSPVYIWFMYCFPLFRTVDFFIGCLLGYLCLENSITISKRIASVCELFMVVLSVLVCFGTSLKLSNTLMIALCNWTTLFVPLAVAWVFVFVLDKGIFTRMFVNRASVFVGNISSYAFLIHYIIAIYVADIIALLRIDLKWQIRIIVVMTELAVSLILSVLYGRIYNVGIHGRKQK